MSLGVPPVDSLGATEMGACVDRVAAAFEQHAVELRRFLSRSLRDADLAADLVGEAFAKLIAEDRAGRFPSQPRPWLYRVAGNLAVTHGRHRQVEARALRALGHREGGDVAPSPEQAIVRGERLGDLLLALAGIGDVPRLAILMSAAGFPCDLIAARIGRSNGATRSLLSRSRIPVRRRFLAIDGDR